MSTLTIKALRSLFNLSLVMCALLFIPAGTLEYWQAWTFLGLYLTISLSITLYLAKTDPALLERRMRGGPTAETSKIQKIIMSIASVGFVSLLLIPALDHRFGWSHMPSPFAFLGDAIVLLGWLCIFFVFKENSFGSATIELAPNQKVIDTGPYALIRHPMYTGGLIMLFGVPIALGSWWGVLAMAPLVPAVIWRLSDEEAFLGKMLPGYSDYRKKVPYRLVPLIW